MKVSQNVVWLVMGLVRGIWATTDSIPRRAPDTDRMEGVAFNLKRTSMASITNDQDIPSSSLQKREATGAGAQLSELGSVVFYAMTVYAGFYLDHDNPQIAYTVMIDTSSSDLWTTDATCRTGGCAGSPTKNSGSRVTAPDYTWKLAYPGGNVSGFSGVDYWTVAGIHIDDQIEFGLATEVDIGFNNDEFFGVVGLGFQEANRMGNISTPLIYQMMNSQVLDSMLVSLHFQRADKGDGEIRFGGINTGFYSGSLVKVPNVSLVGLWEVAVDDVKVSGTGVGFTSKTAVIDSSRETFYMSITDATTLHKAFPSGTTQTVSPGNFQFQCNLTTPLAFVLGKTAFSVSPLDYIGALKTTDTNGTTWCSSNIIGIPNFSVTQWSLGTGFLRNVYTVLDYTNNTLQFAVAN